MELFEKSKCKQPGKNIKSNKELQKHRNVGFRVRPKSPLSKADKVLNFTISLQALGLKSQKGYLAHN